MKAAVVLSALSLFSFAAAVPTRRDNTPTDTDILNFALTLEHLENAFYNQSLAKYSQEDFIKAGLPEWARGRWVEIAQHEQTHVDFLSTALGTAAVKPCQYSFPDHDPKSFADTSVVLETVGTSAYAGAAQFLTNKDYLTAAATILSTEARQTAWINSAVRRGNPWNTAFETPLDLNQVFTLASGFIVSCPADNPSLPVKAFPTLSVAPAGPGQTTKLSFNLGNGTAPSGPLYAAFISGLTTAFVPLGGDDGKEVTIPSDLYGTVYVLVTKDNTDTSDDNTLAGPAMVPFDFNSQGQTELLPF